MPFWRLGVTQMCARSQTAPAAPANMVFDSEDMRLFRKTAVTLRLAPYTKFR